MLYKVTRLSILCYGFKNKKSMARLTKKIQTFFFFFVIGSDSNASGSGECCSVQEVFQRSTELYPHWCVSRPGLCSKVLVGQTVLQQVRYCHWRCAAGAHCRMTNMKLGERLMSESAVACPQCHNDHLVFCRKEHAVCCQKDVTKNISSACLSLWSLSRDSK